MKNVTLEIPRLDPFDELRMMAAFEEVARQQGFKIVMVKDNLGRVAELRYEEQDGRDKESI